MFVDFINQYGMQILYSLITAIAGYVSLELKKLYQKRVDNDTKKDVIKTVVQGVEQLYKDLHGEEKLNKALEAASEMLSEKGIKATEFEMKMLIEAAVAEFNEAFKKNKEVQ